MSSENKNVEHKNVEHKTMATVRNQMYQTAEVSGIVTKVTFGRGKEPTTFNIYCPNIKKTFNAVCELFCPLREGDTIYALCMIGPEQKLYVSKPPFVQPAIDKDSIIQCFMRALRVGFGPVSKLFNTIARIAEGEENVIPFLTGIAQSWADTRKSDILFMFNGTEPEQIEKLLNWWHKERNLRRLHLFGLNNKEINASRLTCDEIYQKCMTNPYTVPAIPIDKCEAILGRLNKKPDPGDVTRGLIIRSIWKSLHENGWTGVFTRFLIKQFPNIKEHVELLKQEYGLVAEMETAYLKFPHKVEKWVSEYLIEKRLKDPINYDTEVDKRIVLPDGRIVERLSAHFTKDNLSEDQQIAVQGALDHNLCVVTGSGGCGKCLAYGTKVLMADGKILPVQYINTGMQVMGPDSKPRNVLSTSAWIGNVSEIIPTKGRSFVCNNTHILTLKGFEPYLGYRKDREKMKPHIAIYSVRGCRKQKAFATEKEAQNFIDNLQEDIFDIPLDEYMLRTKDNQRYCYLYHVGIDFPAKPVPMDPYLIGYWLGDVNSASAAITTADPEIVEEYIKRLEEYDLTLSTPSPGRILYNIVGLGEFYRKRNKFTSTLRDLDMLDNKHIPDIYKCNSREVRLAVLAGLIDSDGYSHEGNHIEIIQKNERLADDIEYLAFSLGFMITRTECDKACEYKGEKRWGKYQRMNIFGEGMEQIPVILPRKQSSIRQMKKRATCFRFEVNPIEHKYIYCGFELDGDGRFLLGDFLVTHNTTCLGQLVHNLELRNVSYAVCSFTGKAVARIREVTKKRNPSTIHRLISNAKKSRLGKKSNQFEKDIPPAEYSHIIIDEASMVTTELFYDLLQVYPDVEKITLFGDVNQLPPISWGSLMEQIMRSETIPTYKLTTNFRVYTTTGDRDGIIQNANAIISHDPVYPFEFIQTNNFSLIEGPIDRVYDIIKGCFGSAISPDRIVIITPFNRSLGELNSRFQEIYNLGKRSVTDSRGVKWMIDDKVMLLENDPDIGVFNGETGKIDDLSDKAILVNFGNSGCHEFLLEPTMEEKSRYGGGIVPYRYQDRQVDKIIDPDMEDETDERTVKRLTHAYAITVDKSQGSEWDFVILYISDFTASSFLNKKRIYTALTRAKRAVWAVVTDIDAFSSAAVKSSTFRCENLSKRLKSKLPELKPFLLKKQPTLTDMADDLPTEIIPADVQDDGFDCDDFD